MKSNIHLIIIFFSFRMATNNKTTSVKAPPGTAMNDKKSIVVSEAMKKAAEKIREKMMKNAPNNKKAPAKENRLKNDPGKGKSYKSKDDRPLRERSKEEHFKKNYLYASGTGNRQGSFKLRNMYYLGSSGHSYTERLDRPFFNHHDPEDPLTNW